MLNKPKGVISATEDDSHKTVIDLIPEYSHLGIFPVGRLDKDTEGLLLLTNDGQFNHELMNPNKHVSKHMKSFLNIQLNKQILKRLNQVLNFQTEKLNPQSLLKEMTIFHMLRFTKANIIKLKRMFHSIENEVLELKRIKIANLELDQSLNDGEFRFLNEQDFNNLKTNKGEGVLLWVNVQTYLELH